MKTWSDFVPLIVGKAPDCPTFDMEDEAKAAATVFFTDTRVWRSAAPVLIGTTVAGQANYAIGSLPTAAKVIGAPQCWVGGTEIVEALPRDIDEIDPFTLGQPVAADIVEPATMVLLPTPNVTGQAVYARLVYAPADDATGIADDLFARYSTVIVALALSQLLFAPGKTWNSPALAAKYEGDYRRDALHFATKVGPIRRNRLRVKKC